MYETFFDLRRRPFVSTADPLCYYPAPTHERAIALLTSCIEGGDGLGVLLGPTGSGKTLISHRLLDRLDPGLSTIMITNTHFAGVADLFQAILYDLSLPAQGSEQDLRLRFIDFLVERFNEGGGALLLIDEAHLLAPKYLEELRLLTNLEGKGVHALRVLLFAGERLLKTLARPELEPFRQRIGVVAQLEGLDHDHTLEYVRAHIAAVGGLADAIFTANALCEIAERSGGLPRRINQLCHRALCTAWSHQSGTVDSDDVAEAASQLWPLEERQAVQTHHLAAGLELRSPPTVARDEPVLADPAPSVVEVGAGDSRTSALDGFDATGTDEPTVIEPEALMETVRTQPRDRTGGASKMRQLFGR